METPPEPPNEAERLASLRRLGILDTPREERFDRITRLAQRLFGTEVAYVSLIDEDRQWFKSRQGFAAPETPRELSFCAHAIAAGPEITVVQDLSKDPRFTENPIVKFDPGVRFYAGCPIAAPDGALLGTLCVLDRRPRDLDEGDKTALRDLAEMVESEIASFNLAVTDELTGLVNRMGYEHIAEQINNVCDHNDIHAAAVFLDLDNMKPINDTRGHDAGDEALVRVAKLLRKSFRASDLIARMGGDEFCVLLTGAAADGAEGAVDRFRQTVEDWNDSGGAPFELSLSIGIASGAPPNMDVSALTTEADKAMYVEKKLKKAAAGEAAR